MIGIMDTELIANLITEWTMRHQHNIESYSKERDVFSLSDSDRAYEIK